MAPATSASSSEKCQVERLVVREHALPGYAARTLPDGCIRCRLLDPGEELTRRAGGAKYVPLPLETAPTDSARALYLALRAHRASTFNIAGNSLHRATTHGWTQPACNRRNELAQGIFTAEPVVKNIEGGYVSTAAIHARAEPARRCQDRRCVPQMARAYCSARPEGHTLPAAHAPASSQWRRRI